MQVFLRAQDHQIWKVVSNGPYELSEDEEKWTPEEIKKSNANWSAMNIMQCSLHPTEFSRVPSCSSAKEIWNRLMVIYEGSSEVKETKANMLVSEYEAFKMKHDETISEMYGRNEEDVKMKKKPLALKASPSTTKAIEESESSTSEDDSGHVKSECPEIQKKTQPRWNRNKQKAMMGTWSEEEEDDEEESSDAEDMKSKLCLMAREKEGEEEEVSSPFKDFTLDD
ncbi:hypothetical protein Taro_045887 [Colocasia esculenta]|uniref:Uncharacterized protein n=1 Tax=Colocasia esculenta TaxID=4460 RepID=A0A843WY30_COLES|nr:hypothetical protein [Colocasia esculenta]